MKIGRQSLPYHILPIAPPERLTYETSGEFVGRAAPARNAVLEEAGI